ncbi:phosphatases II [Xylariaceae sp. AK1471]|nr:phosphatases II [Xylariaceae sp. AK1471]
MAPAKKKRIPLSSTSARPGPVQILPYLYLGPRSTSAPETALAHGITDVISIGCSPDKGDKSISYHRLSLLDNPDADITMVVGLAADIINNAKTQQPDNNLRKVLVHCVAGISRSPTILAGYLMQEGMSLREALGMLVRAKSRVRPNDGFLRQLKEMEISIRGSASIEVDALPTTAKERLRLLGVDVATDNESQTVAGLSSRR